MLRPWVAYALVLLFLSLYPWRFDLARTFPGWHLDWPRTDGDWVDSILNLGAYVPLGFLAFPHLGWRSVLLGGALSACVEVLQVALPGRHPSLRDLFLNTLGTAAGCWLTRQFSIRLPKLSASPALLIAWGLWVTAVALPFFPVLRRSQLATLGDALRNPNGNWERAIDHTFLLVFLILLSGTWRALLPAVFVIAGSGLVYKLRFDYSYVAALAGATLLWRVPVKLLAGTWVPWLAWKQFHSLPGEPLPSAFGWIPLAGLAADPVLILRTVATKALLYGGAIWMLVRAGTRPLQAFSAIAVLLGLGEWAQVYLPGRTPELTDPLLAPLFGWLFVQTKEK